MSVTELAIQRLEKLADEGIGICHAASYRGGLTQEDQSKLDQIETWRFGVAIRAYQMAAERDGKRVPDRIHMVPDSRDRKGLYLSNSGDRPSIYVYGDIGGRYGGITAEDVQSRLSGINPRVAMDFHVHSPGGSFTDACAIHSLIKDRPGSTHGFVDGLAASAGSLILMACTSITMARASKQMIHYSSVSSEASSWREDDLARTLDVVKETNKQVFDLYVPRWKGTKSELDAALKAETYYSPEQAIAVGLADFVSDAVKVAAYESQSYRNAPLYSIAVCDEKAKSNKSKLWMREAKFKLWKLMADEMRDKG